MSEQKNYTFTFGLITILFFFMGFITVLVDSLIPRLRELFDLTYFQAGIVQFAFFSAYFLLSIPSSFVLTRVGYRNGIIISLSTMALGCMLFYPAADFRRFELFIAGYFILAGGLTLLQVAINPYVAVLGSENGSSSRLTLAQAFNSVGTAIAPMVGALFILSDHIKTEEQIAQLSGNALDQYLSAEASAVQTPFVFIGLLILSFAAFFVFVRLPKLMQEQPSGSYLSLFRHKNLMLGVLGIFCYVGAEVAIGSYLVNYFLDMNMVSVIQASEFMSGLAETMLNDTLAGKSGKAIVGVFVTFYWSGAMVGRFIGAYLTRILHPGKVIAIFGSCAVALILISVSTLGLVSMWSILAVGLFNSIMFPTIFTLALRGLGEEKPRASGLLCMAIVGGALIPPMFGFLTDLNGFKFALLALIGCYLYMAFYGYRNVRVGG